MGSESAARLGAAQVEHAKRRAFIVVDENMEHFKEVLEHFTDTGGAESPTMTWVYSALKAVNAR